MILTVTLCGVCGMQELAMAGVAGANDFPYYEKELSTAFVWFNLINFDSEFFDVALPVCFSVCLPLMFRLPVWSAALQLKCCVLVAVEFHPSTSPGSLP
jgi:hypothetical protein